MKYFLEKLANGLTILKVPSNDAESVVVDFFIKTGSRSESARENGIAHFLEHFLFKGTKNHPSAMAISEIVDAIGGEMNANTGKEHTQYYIKATSTKLELIFEVLTDMLQNPLLDEVELEKEKGVIVEEINMYKDSPMYEIENVLENTMWPNDPLGRDIAGSKETVTKFNKRMFQDYMERHYQTPNMILGISGKYDEKLIKKLISKYWANVPKKRFHNWMPAKDTQNQPRLNIQFKETEQAHLAIGFKGFAYGDKRNTSAQVLAAILGGGMSSRLFTEVREKRGLAYYVRSHPGSFQDTGLFQVNSGVQVGKIQEAIKVILSELELIGREPVAEKDLLKAKEYLKGKTTLALEDNQVRLDWYLDQVAFLKNIKSPMDAFAKIDKVSVKDIQAVAKELFNKKKMTLAVIGPYKSDKLFKDLLK